MKNRKTLQHIYSMIFLAVFFMLLFGQILSPDISVDDLSENYLWRKSLISSFLRFKYEIGDRVFPTVLVGEDEWLYYTYNLSMRDYQKVNPLNMSNIKRLSNILEQLNDQVEQNGGTLVIVIPPDKSTIYPQFMPREIPVIGDETSLDRLIVHMGQVRGVRLIDLRPKLIEAGRSNLVYYKTDSHWNCAGAYLAYSSILSEIEDDLPEIPVYEMSEFTILYENKYLDLASAINAPVSEPLMTASPNFDVSISELPEESRGFGSKDVRIAVNSNDGLPTLMVFHDSFYAACLATFMETSFGRTISAKYADFVLSDLLRMIEREKPDVVLVEFAERFMEYFIRQVDQ